MIRAPGRRWLLLRFRGIAYACGFCVSRSGGLPVGGGWKPDLVVGALLLNGAWGAGVALLSWGSWEGHGGAEPALDYFEA